MKKVLFVAAATGFFTACASTYPVGVAFTNAKLPVEATSSIDASKEGRATCKSILALIAIDDCSIATAAKNGGITQIQSIDYEANNILGIYGTYTTIVKGK
ncbi:TRL-like family protein [Campylobacter sp. MIT 97-5078]|uniref:TRL-like family protein n=1 Tax=Campylobacter sp. MIT 97-5078 TaxID=1548153 RepID=UPI000513A6EA|nr:TRL-like family protein [Campylobacter sp. MIT 97-5078]KGI55701.1 hypothetical protein LR59_10860 [Campylobacter sp. MIT 97-5078]TQR28035.1 protein trl [Campylobacter sp. MIT 97-5078]